MIGYVTLGTNSMDRAAAFYDEILGELGAKRTLEKERFICWGISKDKPKLEIIKPFDGNAASVGNGMMVGLVAKNQAQVDVIYNKAIELGGTDEGKPGQRNPQVYMGYFRDLDGNKLSISYRSQ